MDSCSPIKFHYDQSSGFQAAVGAVGMSMSVQSAIQAPNYSPLLPSSSSSSSKGQLEFNYSMNLFASANHQPKHTTFSANGDVHNLPKSMLEDQYGLAGLMVGRQLAVKGLAPYANGLHIASDLLDKPDLYEPLHERFGGPFNTADLETDRQEKVFNPDYLVSSRMISENKVAGIDQLRKLWALRLDNCKEDLLFFLFYSFPRDAIQLVAANHLYSKGWRFHIEFKVWIQRLGAFASEGAREKGLYVYFDSHNWKLMRSELVIDLTKLEGPPNKPPEPSQMQPQCFSRETA